MFKLVVFGDRNLNKKLLKNITIIVIIYILYNVTFYFIGYIVFNYKINDAIRKMRSSLNYHSYGSDSYGKFRWPESINKYVDINNYKIQYHNRILNKYSDIFEYNLEDICNKNNICVSKEDNLFKKYASQIYILLNNYKPSPVVKNKINNTISMPSINAIDGLMRDFFRVSCYYAQIKNSKEALLLAYFPIMVINEIETNNYECSDANLKMSLMDLRNKACMNLLFLANNTSLDKEIAIIISKNLLKLVKSEPSLQRHVEYHRNRNLDISNLFTNNKNIASIEYYLKKISNTSFWKDRINHIYDGASEEIKKVEQGKNPYSLYYWQKNLNNQLSNWIKAEKNDYFYNYINWKRNYTMHIIAKHLQTFFVNFYDLYRKREEYLAITEGTAISLALSAYSSEKDEDIDDINSSMPKNINELSKWLGEELPIDRMSKFTYQFYFADDYFLAGSPLRNSDGSEYFKNYFPYLKNRWVNHSEPMINGIKIPLESTSTNVEEDNFLKNKEKKPESKLTGNIITFGRYEQDGNTENGPEPIEWIILKVDDNKALLISKYILAYQPMHSICEEYDYKTSELRDWLEEEFYTKAFNKLEKCKILRIELSSRDFHNRSIELTENSFSSMTESPFLYSLLGAKDYEAPEGILNFVVCPDTNEISLLKKYADTTTVPALKDHYNGYWLRNCSSKIMYSSGPITYYKCINSAGKEYTSNAQNYNGVRPEILIKIDKKE